MARTEWQNRAGMRWLNRFRKQSITPGTLAQVFHEGFVFERFDDGLAAQLEIPPELVDTFRGKVAAYREAIILMRLIAEAANQSKFRALQSEYEGIIFGDSPSLAGREKLEITKAVMKDLGRLISPQGKPEELTWATEWFSNIGYTVTNPFSNALLASVWMSEYTFIAKTIKELSVQLC